MSSTIWNREIEEGLVAFFNSFMLYINGENKGKPINVKIRKPDDDFREETYPVVYLQSMSQNLNTKRYDPTRVTKQYDEGTHITTIKEAPITMDCVYQVDFYTQYNSEINEMIQAFLKYTHGGRYFSLPVRDQSGNEWELLVLRKGNGVLNRKDTMTEDTRLFHSTFTLVVQTSIEGAAEHKRYTVLEKHTNNLGEEV